MKLKNFFPTFCLLICLFLISWGYTGHRTIGVIAENNLNPKAREAVKNLLGDTSIADACTWAEEGKVSLKRLPIGIF